MLSKRNVPLVCGRHTCVSHAVNFEAGSHGHYAWETMGIALASALCLPGAPLLASFVDAHGHSPLVQLTLWKGEGPLGAGSRKMPVDGQQAESLLTCPPAWRQRLHKSAGSPFLGWCVSRKSNSLRLFIYFARGFRPEGTDELDQTSWHWFIAAPPGTAANLLCPQF